MANDSISVLDSTGVARPVDAQTIGSDYQQTVTLGDGTNAGRVAALTAAGSVNVNIAQSAGMNASAAGNLTATAAQAVTGTTTTAGAVILDVSAAGNASFALWAPTSFVGTVVFEQSFESAGTSGSWASVGATAEDAANTQFSTVPINGAYLRQFSLPTLGPLWFKIRCSAFTSGSLAVIARGGPGWYENAVIQARGSVPTQASVTSSASSTTILAANGNRLMGRVFNDSTSVLYLNETGATASTTAFTQRLQAGQMYEIPHPVHTAAITGIWSSANGAARVTEW